MRTLSARILLGFAALTVTFAVITGNTAFNVTRVGNEIHLILNGYVPLALDSKGLAVKEGDLKAYLDEAFVDDPGGPSSARAQVRSLRDKRNDAFKNLQKNLQVLDSVAEADPFEFKITRERINQLQTAVAASAPIYSKMISSLVHAQSLADEEITNLLEQLRNGERLIFTQTNELSQALEHRVRYTANTLDVGGHKLRNVTIYLGIVATVLGLLITIWVVITLRPLGRLRDAARRVASGNYDSRIPEGGPSEVADLAREFNSMARAVEEREHELVRSERLAAVGKMAAMITHEVRNPLSSIGLNTELLEEELSESVGGEEARQLCSAIHREVDRLTAITEEYLAFGRLPKPKLAHEPVNPMIDALGTFVREDLAAKQVKLAVELGPGDLIALCDPAQLRQCLVNLVRNASDAVATKGGGKVILRTHRAGDRVVIEVEDDGVGIPADVLPRLFDPFFSTKEGGNGLGLALTQQIVRDHGGELTVESTAGRGTTFRLSVPASR
ncbi:MAG: integral rane sensor signal transduction histidine kinase [Myxococcales bacterium]|nr:integral rane sensor signal transduction histidine kinase [Myxococcales bacterium]